MPHNQMSFIPVIDHWNPACFLKWYFEYLRLGLYFMLDIHTSLPSSTLVTCWFSVCLDLIRFWGQGHVSSATSKSTCREGGGRNCTLGLIFHFTYLVKFHSIEYLKTYFLKMKRGRERERVENIKYLLYCYFLLIKIKYFLI